MQGREAKSSKHDKNFDDHPALGAIIMQDTQGQEDHDGSMNEYQAFIKRATARFATVMNQQSHQPKHHPRQFCCPRNDQTVSRLLG